MFPLQRNQDFVFQIFSNPDHNPNNNSHNNYNHNISSQLNKISQDLFFDNNNYSNFVPPAPHHQLGFLAVDTVTTTTTGRSRKRRKGDRGAFGNFTDDVASAAAAATTPITTVDDSNKMKRIMHREIERQRRQEMAALYATLRSLLPLENVKGKRSTSDHMHEALNYIKQMQKNVEELGRKRERLIKMTTSLSTSSNSSSNNNNSLEKNGSSKSDRKTTVASAQNSVAVGRCNDGGVEVLINCGGGCFALSRVIRTLANEGVDVFCCDSTKTDDRLLHKVQSELDDVAYSSNKCCLLTNKQVCEGKSIDLEALEQKLSEVINS